MSKLRALAAAVLGVGMVLVFGVGITTLIERAFIPDPPGPGSVSVHTDTRTGCQYLVALHAGMFPRLGNDGKPMCKEPRS